VLLISFIGYVNGHIGCPAGLQRKITIVG